MNAPGGLPNNLSFDPTPEEADRVAKTVMDLQMGGAADLINTMTFECFEHCVTDFRSRALEKKEKECISKCAKKFGSVVQRVNKRYAEERHPPPSVFSLISLALSNPTPPPPSTPATSTNQPNS